MKYKSLILYFIITLNLNAQEILFPGLKGDSLLSELRRYYTPTTVLPYQQARVKLYTEIFRSNDSLECYYSGYKIPIQSGRHPLAWTARNGIQTEHLYPRSMGSGSMPALGDLHHLVPVRATINSLRRNAPFMDIPDHQTQYWIRDNQLLHSMPSSHMEEYSESQHKAFEPIESVKGDIARSLFYFYTIYQKEAIKKNPHYFTSMLSDLCRWQRIDPVDSTEYKKTMTIGRIQSNINPFIIDPSLAERCYCSTITDIPDKTVSVTIYPNPSKGLFYINIKNYTGPVILKVSEFNSSATKSHYIMYSGLMSWRLNKGIWNIEIILSDNKSFNTTVLIQ